LVFLLSDSLEGLASILVLLIGVFCSSHRCTPLIFRQVARGSSVKFCSCPLVSPPRSSIVWILLSNYPSTEERQELYRHLPLSCFSKTHGAAGFHLEPIVVAISTCRSAASWGVSDAAGNILVSMSSSPNSSSSAAAA
jgi:hypothetical protein